MKIIPIIYTVRGTGPFPIDMLRVDGSSPYSEQDSDRIEISYDRPLYNFDASLQITLIKHNRHYIESIRPFHHWTPNSAKWKAFGWDVISIEEKRT